MLLLLGNAAACVIGLIANERIKARLRSAHPTIWAGLRFPGTSPLVSAQDEGAEISAQFGLGEFLRSDARRGLRDAALDRLVALRRICSWLVVFLLIAAALALALL
jgi:hypothetical protein